MMVILYLKSLRCLFIFLFLSGPSSQSTICCPVDPKNVHTWPPTAGGRGPEAPSSASQCSSVNQGGGAGYQYQYRTTQQPPHPPHSGAPQGCGATSLYHSGPLTTVMTTGTQPTIQVFGTVVPQQTVTIMPSQDPQAVTALPPSAPPPVPDPVPPVVPLSQPQPTTTTNTVAMAPITVTVPISPRAPVGSKSVVTATVQSGSAPIQASTTISGVPESLIANTQLTTTSVFGMPQPTITPAHVTSVVTSVGTQPTTSLSQPSTAVVCEAPQNTLSSAQLPTDVGTGVPQSVVNPQLVTTAVVTGVPHTVINPTRLTSTVVTGAPHPYVASSQDSANITSELSHPVAASSLVATAVTSRVSQPVLSHTENTTAVFTSIPQSVVAPTQDTTVVVTCIPQPVKSPTQVTTAVVTGIPQSVVAPTQVTSTLVTGIPHPVQANTQDTTVAVTGIPQSAVTPTQVTTAVASGGIPQSAVSSTQVATTEVTGIPQYIVAPAQVATAVVTSIPQPVVVSTQVTTSVVTCIPQPVVASTQVTSAVVIGLPQSTVSSSQVTTTAVMGMPQCTTVSSENSTIVSHVCQPAMHTHLPDNAGFGISQPTVDESEVDTTVSKSHIASTQVTTADITNVPKVHVVSTKDTAASVSAVPKLHIVSTQAATTVVTDFQKIQMASTQTSTAAVTSVQEPHKVSTQVTRALVTDVPKPPMTSTQANTVIASGEPRLALGSTQVTTVCVSAISCPVSHATQAITGTVAEAHEITNPSGQTDTNGLEKLQHNGTDSRSKEVPHAIASSLSVEHGSSEARRYVAVSAPSKQNIRDPIDHMEMEAQVVNARTAFEPTQTVFAHGNSLKDELPNTCPVPLLKKGDAELPSKKRKITSTVSLQAIESQKSVNTATYTQLNLDFPNVDSRPNTSWSPTQSLITSEAPQFLCASNTDFGAQTTTSVSNSCITTVAGTTGITTRNAFELATSPALPLSSSVVASSSISHTLTGQTNSTLLSPSKPAVATQTTSTAPIVCTSTTTSSHSQQDDISVLRDRVVMSVQSKVAQNNDTGKNCVNSDSGQLGNQRPGTRHLLCQALPTLTLTKTATAHLAKAKSSSNSNMHRLMVKSEEKNRDMKLNIPEHVPISQNDSSSFEVSPSMISIKNSQKNELGSELLDVKTDIISSTLVRKRGRPPKIRDTSSDNSILDTSVTKSKSSSDHKCTTVKPCFQNMSSERNPNFPREAELHRNRTIVVSAQENKMLRSHLDEKNRDHMQSSKMSISPSKQVDCKQDIKPSDTMKMMSIKTEVMPKIKTEKVSPKGVTKLSSLKVSPKDISHFKTKIVNGQGEISLKSGSVSEKCDLSSPTKAMEFTDTKSLRDVKKSPLGLLSDQRVPKNSVVASKSKSKEAFDKKFITSSDNLKKRNSESIGTSNKALVSTKTSVTEGETKAPIGAKHQTLKPQKITKPPKGTSRRSPPNGKLNRKKSLLSYLKEKNNESDTSSVDSEVASGGRKRSRSKEESPESNSASPFPTCPPLPINAGSRRRSATVQGKCKPAKKPKWVNNWSWEGEPFEGKIWLRVSMGVPLILC